MLYGWDYSWEFVFAVDVYGRTRDNSSKSWTFLLSRRSYAFQVVFGAKEEGLEGSVAVLAEIYYCSIIILPKIFYYISNHILTKYI
jgi:hypothetical protein